MAALCGILEAGGAYLPLDARYPRERLAGMLSDGGAKVLVGEETWGDLAAEAGAVLCRPEEVQDQSGSTFVPALPTPDQLAYVIFTSGSTGRPKGVGITQGSAASLVQWASTAYTEAELSRVLATTSISFDLSVFELFVPLSLGGSVVLLRDALALGEGEEVSATLLNTVPSALKELISQGARIAGLRAINLAGEALERSLVTAAEGWSPSVRLANLYGPTEDTTYSTLAWMSEEMEGIPSIGRPLPGTRGRVVDGALGLVPVGVAGELLLGGIGLSRGYLGRPDLTAERFVPDPYGSSGSRSYRTGDQVRWRTDGRLDYLGRLDHQVKLRGFRIELGEVESALSVCAGVASAVAMVRQDAPGDRRLVAYVVGAGLSPESLRRELSHRLPEPMVPSSVVVLDRWPLTPTGKVDRRSLSAPDREARDRGSMRTVPRSGSEEVLASIWSEVLGLSEVGSEESFFDLGGHSLLATRVISRVRRAFSIDLPLRSMFEEPTLRGLARRIERLRREGAEGAETLPPPLVAREGGSSVRLSFAQERLWFLSRLDPDSPAYNLAAALRLAGGLSLPALSRAVGEIVRRHEVLRTRYAEEDGEPVQRIDPAPAIRLPIADLSSLKDRAREEESLRLSTAESLRPFDLSRGPVLRSSLLRLGEREHAVLFALHHIAGDGWSLGVLVSELSALYGAYVAGERSPLAELPVQYADFALWQRSWLSGDRLEAEIAYWREALAGAPPLLSLPTDRARPAVASERGDSVEVSLDSRVSEGIRTLARRESATPYMVLLAAYQVLLSRLSGDRDVSVGSPVAGRHHVETEGLIGFFVNTLVLRSDLSDDASFEVLVSRARRSSLAAQDHQDLPFERLVEELSPERSLSWTPLFQAMLVVQNVPEGELSLPGLSIAPLGLEGETAKFDLSLSLSEVSGGYSGSLTYRRDLWDGSTLRRWWGHWETLLAGALANPGLRASELPLLSASERAEILEGRFGGVEVEPVRTTLAELLRAQALRTPERPALIVDGREWIYGWLASRSRSWAVWRIGSARVG